MSVKAYNIRDYLVNLLSNLKDDNDKNIFDSVHYFKVVSFNNRKYDKPICCIYMIDSDNSELMGNNIDRFLNFEIACFGQLNLKNSDDDGIIFNIEDKIKNELYSDITLGDLVYNTSVLQTNYWPIDANGSWQFNMRLQTKHVEFDITN